MQLLLLLVRIIWYNYASVGGGTRLVYVCIDSTIDSTHNIQYIGVITFELFLPACINNLHCINRYNHHLLME